MDPIPRPGRTWPKPAGPVLVAAAALLACGPEPPEQQLAEAREQMVEVRSDVRSLEEQVADRREAVRRTEQALAEVREELQRAEQRLAEARQRIQENATDVALFRAVQSALLESDALEDFAIRADVDGGVVTLRGEVAEPKHAERALELARGVVGVENVRSDIQVREPGETSG